MVRARKNVVANFLGRGISAASTLLFIPLYLRFLGIEAYGVVGFFAVLQTVFAFADIGLTATLNREMARMSVRDDAAPRMRDLVRTIEIVYWFAAVSAMLGLVAGAEIVAGHWLTAGHLERTEVVRAVRMMGVVFALQLPSGLYVGGMLGRERQVLANALQTSWNLLRGGGAVVVLWLASPTLVAFFGWQIAVNALYVVVTRQALISVLPSAPDRARFRAVLLQEVWRYAAGMFGLALLSAGLSQTDRLAVSKLLSLEQFGYYVMAGALAQVPLLIVGPVASAMFPRFTVLLALGDRAALSELYHRVCQVTSTLALPVGLTLSAFSYFLVLLWTGSTVTAREVWTVVSILSLGYTFLALQIIPYNLALASGWLSLNVTLSVVSLVLMVPLVIALVHRYGLLGGGIAWLCLNAGVTPPLIYFLHRRLLPGEAARWWLQDVGRPFAAVLICIAIGYWLMPAQASRLVGAMFIGVITSAAVAAAALSIPGLVPFALQRSRWRRAHSQA